jgi:replication factor C subunit 1
LAGLTFVVTGVLETIERETAVSLIKQCGGRVTSTISRNTSYIVVGDVPGLSKVKKVSYMYGNIMLIK